MDLKVRFLLIFILASEVSSKEYEFLTCTTRRLNMSVEQIFNNRISKLEEQVQKVWNHVKSNKVVKMSKNNVPKNCKEVLDSGKNISGVYSIQPKDTSESFLVYCNMKLKDGGWMYFLNRFDGSVDFYLDWEHYKEGFGNVNGEFWLGLQHLHELTGDSENELLVELIDWNNTKVYAHYSSFAIGSEEEGFSLKVIEGYSGDAGDSLEYSNGMKFSTRDQDQDDAPVGSCATTWEGGWWYKNCKFAHLTDEYVKDIQLPVKKFKNMYWNTFHGPTYSLKEARMMMKPKNNNSKVAPN